MLAMPEDWDLSISGSKPKGLKVTLTEGYFPDWENKETRIKELPSNFSKTLPWGLWARQLQLIPVVLSAYSDQMSQFELDFPASSRVSLVTRDTFKTLQCPSFTRMIKNHVFVAYT